MKTKTRRQRRDLAPNAEETKELLKTIGTAMRVMRFVGVEARLVKPKEKQGAQK